MSKFKPIPFSEIPAADDPLIDGINLVFRIIVSISDKEGFICGSCKKQIIVDKKGSPRPLVCSYCEQQIDWIAIKTRLIKVCPTCGFIPLDFNSVVCEYHFPAVKLEQKEIDMSASV